MKKQLFYAITLMLLCSSGISKLVAQEATKKTVITLPAEVVVDKIRGGVLGMMLGNMNGWSSEFKNYDKHGEVKTYTPSLLNGAETDDDTDFEWVYIYNMQKTRTTLLPYDDINALWTKTINRRIWCANRQARYLMDLGIKPPMTGNVVLNPWAEFNVSGQFLCESYGLVAPAMPQTAAKIGLHYTKVAIDNEPAQTTQLFTSMISTAFVESDINKILDAGVASLDPNSIIIHIIEDVRKWHSLNPDKPEETHRLLHEKYELKDDLTRNRNGHELNTAAIIAAILHGNGDLAETIRHSMNFGYDSDCNCATVGTLLGTIYGHRRILNQGWKIVDRYKNTTRDNMPMDETIISFADRVVEVFEMVNQENGGSKSVVNNTVVYNIQSEKPASVIKLLSSEEEKQVLKTKMEKEIIANLNGNRQEKARAAYFAVCLDMDNDLKKKYPKQWKEAFYDLSGYWKVITMIHSSASISMAQLKKKFITAGFVPLNIKPNDKDLFNDMEAWKDPKTLYTATKEK